MIRIGGCARDKACPLFRLSSFLRSCPLLWHVYPAILSMVPQEIETQLRALLDHQATEEEVTSFLTFLDDEILRISASDDSDEGQKQRLVSNIDT